MRRSIATLALAAGALALWPAAPAGATHAPCIPADQLCLRIACPNPTQGSWWIYVDSRGLPFTDFSDCPPLRIG